LTDFEAHENRAVPNLEASWSCPVSIVYEAGLRGLRGERRRRFDGIESYAPVDAEDVAEFSIPILAEAGLGPNWRDIK